MFLLCCGVARGDDAPCQKDTGLPIMWGELLEEQVAGGFEDNICDLIMCKRQNAVRLGYTYTIDRAHPVVVVRRHFELFQDVGWVADL